MTRIDFAEMYSDLLPHPDKSIIMNVTHHIGGMSLPMAPHEICFEESLNETFYRGFMVALTMRR